MNAKDLYREIGQIDDLIIEEAARIKRYKITKSHFIKVGAMAACFILVVYALWLNFGTSRNIYMNDLTVPNAKRINEIDENATEKLYTFEEAKAYFSVDILPKKLPQGMSLIVKNYPVYFNADSTVNYDLTWFSYADDNTDLLIDRYVGIYASKEGFRYRHYFNGNEKVSEINGIEMLVGRFEAPYFDENGNRESYVTYISEFEYEGISITVIADYITEKEFTNILQSMIKQ